ncbi:haloacid dehalogenase type II [Halostella sp. JP-L12]|uniref:haloacid dehalogenase type II n=1 Tax=Halostella TaxID=1843185 RepID=UPI000EF82D9E|nr:MULTISPECIES: haloacid dehalogenase type II [Halostella]NHN46757.1 haloacid dehalogenase type II [Halostella sp. JP-L12]
MALNRDAVEAIAFDSYGTLVDPGSVTGELAEHVDDPDRVAERWRTRSLEYAFVGTAIGEYDTFYEMNRHALRYALHSVDAEVSEDEREAILEAYHDLDVFDDVRPGMERLVDAGYDCYVLSNGNPEMLDSMIETVDIGDLIEGYVSADEIERFKPVPEIYEHAADRIGVPTGNVLFVAAGWWDVPGALRAGMQGVWVNRQDTVWGPYEVEPDLTIDSFEELADELDA